MKTLLLIWSLFLGHCLAGTTNIWGCWAATPFRATNRVALSYMASQPPFATNGVSRLIIGDYDLSDANAPFRLLETNGLAVYSPADAP